ncbi:MAG: HSP20 family molecular chaperone IbpA [Kiritimatiellia bacterium]|jgi:HSP20 family molecular chaperone IbpA
MGQVAWELNNMNFSHYTPVKQSWAPPINLFRFPDRYEMYVEIAGVDQSAIDLVMDAHQMVIRGTRRSFEPDPEKNPCQQMIGMEIQHGRFRRTVQFTEPIQVEAVVAEQKAGILFIKLPLIHPGSCDE